MNSIILQTFSLVMRLSPRAPYHPGFSFGKICNSLLHTVADRLIRTESGREADRLCRSGDDPRVATGINYVEVDRQSSPMCETGSFPAKFTTGPCCSWWSGTTWSAAAGSSCFVCWSIWFACSSGHLGLVIRKVI